jgi:transcriptional regulator with XRE-family HTH domain
MSKPFKALIAKLPPERQARIQDRTAELSGKMALQELRQALKLTQQQIAATQHLNQAAVSKLEHQSDMYISTLRRFIKAMGGELRIVAHFPQKDITINQFEEIDSLADKAMA